MRRFISFLMLSPLLLSLLMACGDADAAPSGAEPVDSSDSGVEKCIDADGDGFGRHCKAGPDCNDADDTLSDDCLCSAMAEGCSCDPDAAPIECMLTALQLSHDNTLCKTGFRYCRDSVWTACIGVAAIAR